MDIINRFKDPERWSDYNLACFFVQLTVILLASFLVFKFCVYGNPEFSSYRNGGVVSSIASSLKAEPGEEKLLRKIPSLNSDEKYVKTDKFIDIAHGGRKPYPRGRRISHLDALPVYTTRASGARDLADQEPQESRLIGIQTY